MSTSADTIAAVATPPGEGGIAIVRVSGRGAKAVAEDVLRPLGEEALAWTARGMQVARAWGGEEGAVLDEVVALWMPGPASYTREDVLEIQCHGGVAAARRVLDRVLGVAGVRLAEPGEFTLRAFLRGRLDLVQAEAVLDVIRARTEESLQVHEDLLAGRLSAVVQGWQSRLADILVAVEGQLDFAEEEDIGQFDAAASCRALAEVVAELRARLGTYHWGRRTREGFRVALLGSPNTGKSSLLNALLEEERAIVSCTPGTTRDAIEAWVNACGVPVQVIDTAGLRETDDAVEAEGVERARRAAAGADLVLLVVDGSRSLDALEEREAAALAGEGKALAVLNKCDLARVPAGRLEQVFVRAPQEVSAKTGAGMGELLRAIRDAAWAGGGPSGEAPLTRERQRQAVAGAAACLEQALGTLERPDGYLEVVASEIHAARGLLRELLGWGTPEDVLERIFSEFCIGK